MRKIKKEKEEIMFVEVSPTDRQKIIELFRNFLTRLSREYFMLCN